MGRRLRIIFAIFATSSFLFAEDKKGQVDYPSEIFQPKTLHLVRSPPIVPWKNPGKNIVNESTRIDYLTAIYQRSPSIVSWNHFVNETTTTFVEKGLCVYSGPYSNAQLSDGCWIQLGQCFTEYPPQVPNFRYSFLKNSLGALFYLFHQRSCASNFPRSASYNGFSNSFCNMPGEIEFLFCWMKKFLSLFARYILTPTSINITIFSIFARRNLGTSAVFFSLRCLVILLMPAVITAVCFAAPSKSSFGRHNMVAITALGGASFDSMTAQTALLAASLVVATTLANPTKHATKHGIIVSNQVSYQGFWFRLRGSGVMGGAPSDTVEDDALDAETPGLVEAHEEAEESRAPSPNFSSGTPR